MCGHVMVLRKIQELLRQEFVTQFSTITTGHLVGLCRSISDNDNGDTDVDNKINTPTKLQYVDVLYHSRLYRHCSLHDLVDSC